METMKRVLALLLVFAMLIPNLTTIASAADTGEDSATFSTEPVATEATETATEAPTESPLAETEAPTEATEPSVQETEPPTETTEPPAEETEPPVEETTYVEEVVTIEETVADPAAIEQITQTLLEEIVQVEETAAPVSDYSNDDMFAMYLDRLLYPDKPSTLGTAGFDTLDDKHQALYQELAAKAADLADNGGSSVYTPTDETTLSAMGFQTAMTAQEVAGTEYVTELTDAHKETIRKLFDLDLSALVDALLVDLPYELYWYDKEKGAALAYNISLSGYNVNGEVQYTQMELVNVQITFQVASAYQDGSSTAVSVSAANEAAAVKSTAQAVVTQNEAKTDHEKLIAYKDYICDQVSYNDEAAASDYTGGYGDPWQLIYVFDGDSGTNVVCEGYSKAFQYLCDLSEFEGNVESFLVTGYAGGPHMWNIVSIDDRNYMVDVTNTDPDDGSAFGQDGSVFLTGAEGSIADGYTFTSTVSGFGSLTYQYSYDVTYTDGTTETIRDSLDVYGEDEDSILNLSDISYAEYLQQQEETVQPVEQESYISLRFLSNLGSGWFEDQNSVLTEGIYISPSRQFYLIAYLNHWNYEAQAWDVEPIHASKLVVDENLVLEPFSSITDGSSNTQEGENFDCFFRLSVADGVDSAETNILYSNTEIQAPVTVGWNSDGFYSADPTAEGADKSSLWLNAFTVSSESRTFYYYFDPSLYRDGTWNVTEVTLMDDTQATAVQVKDNLWKITISDEYVDNIYSKREFALQLCCTYSNGESSYEGYPGITCQAPDFGDPSASFVIDGQRYHASWNYDGLFVYEGEEGSEYPVPAEVAGVSYDIASNTLTLSDADLETLHINHHRNDEATGEEGYDLPDSRFNIELVGSSSISATNDHPILISNDVYLTITGDGSLTVSLNGDETNMAQSAFEANDSDVTIAGNANVTVEISGTGYFVDENGVTQSGNLSPLRGNGNDRWLRLRDNAVLTTKVPENVCSNGYFDESGSFVEGGGFCGIQFFYIEVNDNATLNTQTIRVWDAGQGQAYGAYHQNGGTVNVTGIPYYNKDFVSEDTSVTGHYHFSGVEADYGQIYMNGGVLNVNMTATDAQMEKSVYYHAIQSRGRYIGLNGGEINITGNFSGTGIKVGEDDWDGGTNAWVDFNGVTLNMTDSDLYRCAIDVAPNGSINFNGGVINAQPADINIRGSMTWNGTELLQTGSGVNIVGNAVLNGGHFVIQNGYFQVQDGATLQMNDGYVELDNSFVYLAGDMNMENGAFIQAVDYTALTTDATFVQALVIAQTGSLEIGGNAYLEVSGTDKVDGIYNEGIFRQYGGSVNVGVDGTVENTLALFGPGSNRFENGNVYLTGYNALVQFNADENSQLYVGGNTTMNAIGRAAGITTYAPAIFEGGNVHAYAECAIDSANDVYPYAVIVENNEDGTNASLTISGGNHYFESYAEGSTVANGRGLAARNASVTFSGGTVTIDAEMAVYNVTDGTASTVSVPVIVSNETGAVLELNLDDELGAYTLLGSVGFLTSQECGENVQWDLTDGVLTISVIDTAVDGIMDDYHMPTNDPASWRTAPWYSMRDIITKVVVEEGVTTAGDWAFGRLPNVLEIVYPATVTSIDMTSSYACPALEKFTIAEGNQVYSVTDDGKVLVENGSLVLAAVKSITSYKAADGITTIGMGAFDSTALVELDLNQVTTIQNYAFADCYDLKTVVIPEGVATIELTVFQNSGLESITIPASVTKIRNYAFDGCSALAEVIYLGSESQWNAIAIGTGNNALTRLPITFMGTSEAVAGEPYLSYHLLKFSDQGYYEDMSADLTEMTVPVGFYTCMVVYLNVWNEEEQLWERSVVDPEQLYGEDLNIGLFRNYVGIGIEEGEPNADNFFEMAVTSGWGETRDLSYKVSEDVVATLPITLTRSSVGFYSADPTGMSDDERDAAWLNFYRINPNVSGHSVYFAVLDGENSFTSVTVDSDRLSEEDLAKLQVEKISDAVYKITLPDEVAAKVYEYSGIPLQVTYQIGEETQTVDFTFGSVSFAGDCVSFVINGIGYEYYPGLEGYFSWDNENQKRLAYKELPGNITYDYENDVLTMNNSTIESLQIYWNWHNEETGDSGYATKDSDLTLQLVGENKIINPNSNAALAVGDALTLTITGDADSSLLISATNENATANSSSQNAVNIYNDADLIIAGDTTVTTSISSNAAMTDGWLMNIWAGGSNTLTIKDNATLNTTVPEGARDDGDARVNGYRGIDWFGELRVQDNATLNTTTLSLNDYYDENNVNRGKGSYVQTGGTVTIEALGWTNDDGSHGYNGFTINGGSEAVISGGKLIVKAEESNIEQETFGEDGTYSWFSGIQANGYLEISGENTQVELQIPYSGAGLEVNGAEVCLQDSAEVKVVGNGQDNHALLINEGGNFQLQGGKVDVTDAKVTIQERGRMEIYDGTLSVMADTYPNQTYLEMWSQSDFILHNGTVTVNNGMTADTPNAVSIGGRMELKGGTMDVTGTNAVAVRSDAELSQNGAVLNVKGYVTTLTTGDNGVIYLNDGVTNTVLGEAATGGEGGNIDIGGLARSVVSASTINTWSAAANVYSGGRMDINGGQHTFQVAGTPGTDSEGNAIWLSALDVNGSVNFNGGVVDLDAGTGGQALFNRATSAGTTVCFNNAMGAVSADSGISLSMHANGNSDDEYCFALGTAENAGVSSAKITQTSAGDSSSWRIETDGTNTTLIISGSENMYNYYMPQGEAEADWLKTPWYDYNDQITHVVVEDGITHIGDWVFARMTKLVNVKLPSSVNYISTSAFYGCTALENFTMPGNDTYFLDENTRTGPDADGYYTGNVIIEGNWKVLLAAPSVTEYTVPQHISEIGSGAFQNCTGLTGITFATDENGWSNVWNIGSNAFANTGLTAITLPNGVKAICGSAFANCESVTAITLPDSVNAIRPYAFSGCGSAETTVTFQGNESQWNQIAIGSGNSVLDRVTFQNTDEESGDSYLTFHWLNYGENGWEENEHSANQDVYAYAGTDIYGVFYYNHWDEENSVWTAEAVIPEVGDKLTLAKLDDAMLQQHDWKIQEGETNADFFVCVTVASDAWDTADVSYGIVTYEDATLDIQIHRDECGFYSGTTASDETWLNYYEMNPLKPYQNIFYFIFENSDERTMDDSSFHIWNSNGIPDAYFRTYDVGDGVFKIVLDPVFLQDAWEYGGGFQLYAGFNVTVAGQDDPEYKQSEVQVRAMDLSSPDAVFEIDGLSYLYFQEDNGWMTYGDPANDYRPGVVRLPTGVSYNYSSNTLTLTNATLNNLNLSYAIYDENGAPTDRTNLPNHDLTLNLIGSSLIETGHRNALNIYGGLNVTVTGSGSLRLHAHNDPENRDENGNRYAFDTVALENGSTLTIAGGNVTAEISGEGYWNEGDPAMPAAIRGRNGSSLVISGGSLTTQVPENARDNGPREVDFEDYYSTRAISDVTNISVTGGTLNTSSLYLNEGETFSQSGGTANVTGQGHISLQRDENGNQYQNYHYNGIQLQQGASAVITGGQLNLTVTPEDWEYGSNSFYNALSIAGGSATISDQAQISVTGAYDGNAISVGNDYDENGQPCANGSLNMTGGTLTLSNTAAGSRLNGLEVQSDCTANITGGTLNLTPADSFAGINNMGTLTISGSAVVNLNQAVCSSGKLTVDGATIDVTHEKDTDLYAWDIVPGTSFEFLSGTITSENAAFCIGGIMSIGENAALTLTDSEFNADGEINFNGGSLTMKQTDLVDNLFLGTVTDEWGNTWDSYKHQSRLYVTGVLNLNSGKLDLTNVPMDLHGSAVVNQNGAAVSMINAAVPASTRSTTGNEGNDWMASVNTDENTVLNLNGGSFTIDITDFDGGMHIRGSLYLNDGLLNVAVPGGLGIAARGQVHVSGGEMTLSGNVGYEQAYEEGFEQGKLTVTGGTISIAADNTGINLYNNMVVTGGDINIDVSGSTYTFTDEAGEAMTLLTGTGISGYSDENRRISISINGGTMNIDVPVEAPSGYNAISAFGILGGQNTTIRINGGDIGIKARTALYAESLEKEKHIVINNRLHVLSLDTGNTLNISSGTVEVTRDDETYVWYVDTYEEDEEFTTPYDNTMMEGYATNLRIVSKSAGTNAFWDMEDGVLTITAASDKIGNMTKDAAWNYVADKVTSLILDQNVEQPADLTQDLFPNLTYVKTPCHMSAASFTGVTVELIHELVDGECQKCDYSEVVVEYKYGQNVQIRLIEPWGLKANAKISTAEASPIDYSKLYDYGVYFIRGSKLDTKGLTQATITVDDILNDTDAVKKTKADGVTIDSGYLSAIYDNDIYTYELSDSIFVMFYFVTEEGTDPIYIPIRERNLKSLAQQRKDDAVNFPNELERAVYLHMTELETNITTYRADFTNLTKSAEQKAPTLAEYSLGEQAVQSNYTYGNNAQIRLIEPWGLKANVKVSLNGQVIDYNTVEEYGIVALADNDQVYTEASEILKNENAYVFSSKNQDAVIDSGYISAAYTKGIYTYQLDTDIYVFGYIKDADGYHYGPVRNRNVCDLMIVRKDDAANFPNEKERAVYADMVNLYNAITAYRDDYFNKK